MTSSHRRLWLLCVAATMTAIPMCAASNCGGDSSPTAADPDAWANTDAGGISLTDASGNRDASATGTCSVAPNAQVTDWSGWRRVTVFDPCCVTDIPIDMSAVPALSWRNCMDPDAAPGCLEMIPSPDEPSIPTYPHAYVSHDGQGRPKYLVLWRVLSSDRSKYEEDVYDIQSGQGVAAIRVDDSVSRSTCHSEIFPSDGAVTFVSIQYATGDVVVASGEPRSILRAQTPPRRLAGIARGAVQGLSTSNTTLAFDVQPAGIVYREKLDSGAYASTSGKADFPKLLDFVERDDVYARVDGQWTSEYRIDPGGTATLLRALSDRHVSAFQSDGVSMFWMESAGSMLTPNSYEAWTAAYTSDPQTLSAGAHKLAAWSGNFGIPLVATALNGIYAVIQGTDSMLVRSSDGATKRIAAPSGVGFAWAAAVSASEVWAIAIPVSGYKQYRLLRLQVGGW